MIEIRKPNNPTMDDKVAAVARPFMNCRLVGGFWIGNGWVNTKIISEATQRIPAKYGIR